jgi:hypothetical protein
MAIYSTLYGLPQSMVDYLNQPLPDISNLYTPPVAGINPIKPSPDDPQGIVSLYPEVAARVVIVAILFSILIQQE